MFNHWLCSHWKAYVIAFRWDCFGLQRENAVARLLAIGVPIVSASAQFHLACC